MKIESRYRGEILNEVGQQKHAGYPARLMPNKMIDRGRYAPNVSTLTPFRSLTTFQRFNLRQIRKAAPTSFKNSRTAPISP